MGKIPIPADCILRTFDRVIPFSGEKRWRSKGRYYTWDGLHGEIEMFNSRGKHLGVLNCEGILIKSAVEGRTIDV